MAKSKFSIEEAFTELDEILERLNDPKINMSDSMELYKKGVKLLERCNKSIDQTEKELIILQEGQKHDIVEGTDWTEGEKN